MKFKTLIKSNAWLSVKVILLKLYPDEVKSIEGYEVVFNKLLFMNPVANDMSIVIALQKDDFDGEEYISVSGKYNHPKNDEEKFSQAIEFTAWNEWLGMDICEESLLNFNELEIIAHCLFEMTFVGFEEEEIQKQLIDLKKTAEEFKNITDEEKKANTISLEDLIKDLENDKNNKDKDSTNNNSN